MSRRVLTVLIVVVGLAGLSVAGLATVFAPEDSVTITQPGPVRSVEVEVDSGRVVVVAAAADAATVERTRRWVRGRPVTEERLVDGVLRITADCRRFVRVGCESDYRIEAPAGVSVRVRNQRGSVSVTGIAGMVDIETGGGGVRLDRTKGPVRVTTSAGGVEGVDLSAGIVDVTTGAGPVRLTMAEAPERVGLRTGAGSIDLALPPVHAGYRVDAKAGAGKVDISVDQNPGGLRSVVADSHAGGIRIHPR